MNDNPVTSKTGCENSTIISGSVNSKGQTVTSESFDIANIHMTIAKVEGFNGQVDYYIDKSMD